MLGLITHRKHPTASGQRPTTTSVLQGKPYTGGGTGRFSGHQPRPCPLALHEPNLDPAIELVRYQWSEETEDLATAISLDGVTDCDHSGHRDRLAVGPPDSMGRLFRATACRWQLVALTLGGRWPWEQTQTMATPCQTPTSCWMRGCQTPYQLFLCRNLQRDIGWHMGAGAFAYDRLPGQALAADWGAVHLFQPAISQTLPAQCPVRAPQNYISSSPCVAC